MRTYDTDVVVILVAYMIDFLEIDSNVRVSIVSVVGFNTSCISVNVIATYIGLKRCKELLFGTLFQVVIILQALSLRKSGILGCMAKEFSSFRKISAI